MHSIATFTAFRYVSAFCALWLKTRRRKEDMALTILSLVDLLVFKHCTAKSLNKCTKAGTSFSKSKIENFDLENYLPIKIKIEF